MYGTMNMYNNKIFYSDLRGGCPVVQMGLRPVVHLGDHC